MSKRVYLSPSEFALGYGDGTQYATVLGSCVSVIFWHATSRYFALCHYLLDAPADTSGLSANLGKYGSGILPYIRRHFTQYQLLPDEFWVGLVGGSGNAHASTLHGHYQIGHRNIKYADNFLKREGFVVDVRDVGGHLGRKLVFDSGNGELDIVNLPEVC